jgi:hypothetical protein
MVLIITTPDDRDGSGKGGFNLQARSKKDVCGDRPDSDCALSFLRFDFVLPSCFACSSCRAPNLVSIA